MPLKPILQRTLAIFRQRPFWFVLPQLAIGAFNLLPWTKGPQWLQDVQGLVALLLLVPLIWISILVLAFPITLTLEIENGGSFSARRAWNRARIQRRLITTNVALGSLYVFAFIALLASGAVLAEIMVRNHLGQPEIWRPSHVITTLIGDWCFSAIYILLCRASLAIPLLFVIHPDSVGQYEPIKSSWRLSRGIVGLLLLIAFCLTVPTATLKYFADHSHTLLDKGLLLTLNRVVDALAGSLGGIALTLIALERGYEPQGQEISQSGILMTPSTSQVAIL